MAGSRWPGWVRRLEADGPTPDGDLLRRFSAHADPDAFELLVRRHAPTVLRICRAVARDPHLAEDAAQAVFLALARKAGALVGVRSAAGWLARVAYRAARRARARAAARPAAAFIPESHPAPGPDPADAAAAADLAAVVLDEVHRLPERYRSPVVLCYLDGFTYAEAAVRLGCPAGTVAGRLARARAVLRDRLLRRGVAVPAAGLGAVLGAPAAVPAGFAGRVLRGVAAPDPFVAELTREVLRAMSPSFRQVVFRAAAALALVAAVVAVPLGAGDRPAPEPPKEKKVAARPADPDLAFDEQLAREKKFVVVGTVVQADGKTPLEGVEVMASAGIGTLRRTGRATTDKDGKFRLVFRAGLWMEGGKPGGVAVVSARKPGWYGWSYGWPAQFVLTDAPIAEAEQRHYPGHTNLTPGRPSRLAFRMQPAASLKVKLVDGAGKPLAGTRVWLTGDKLPPATSALADGRTDAAGTFAVADVPRGVYRVVIEDRAGGRRELELGSVRFADAAEYEAVGTVHQWEPGQTHVEWKVTRGKGR